MSHHAPSSSRSWADEYLLDTGSHPGGEIRFGFCPNADGLERARLIEILPDRMGRKIALAIRRKYISDSLIAAICVLGINDN